MYLAGQINQIAIKHFVEQNLDAMQWIAEGCHHDPFSVLGIRYFESSAWLLIYRPHGECLSLSINDTLEELHRIENSDFFVWCGNKDQLPKHPRLLEVGKNQQPLRFFDPYSFQPLIAESELEKFHQQEHWESYSILGAHLRTVDDIEGTLFSIWAPNAGRVSVVGDFNCWDGRVHPMRCRGKTGVWELFVPDIGSGSLYKFEIRNRVTGQVLLKSVLYARYYQVRPDNASCVWVDTEYAWHDDVWMSQRRQYNGLDKPISIYEVHLGSWMERLPGDSATYKNRAHQLVAYVKQQGYTHIQLMPITEYPYDASWGYQVTGYFAPTSRFGEPEDFKYFVDWCHQNEVGVLLDWVPAHFPKDEHGLAHFDGTALYEHADPKQGEHKDWGTLVFNYQRREVCNFLLSSAHFWVKEFHLDGLRVDAVASMLYLDYSKNEGEWIPNEYGGHENLSAIQFIRRLNTVLHRENPGLLMVAEESTAWPQVTCPVDVGGLGFTLKWNMGWMNDTLAYITEDPVHRKFHHRKLTFSLLYAFTENFVLPFSHDEVVHGKRSILNKMPGDDWQRFANARLLYVYLFTHPGKKLLFMGSDFAQGSEWDYGKTLDWDLLEIPFQKGVQVLVKDLNTLYCSDKSLYQYDFDPRGFQWLDCDDESKSVISFIRWADNDFSIVLLNFTPVPREDYRVGVPQPGLYGEVINSDSIYYQGSNVSNSVNMVTESVASMGFESSLVIKLPPLAGIIIKKMD